MNTPLDCVYHVELLRKFLGENNISSMSNQKNKKGKKKCHVKFFNFISLHCIFLLLINMDLTSSYKNKRGHEEIKKKLKEGHTNLQMNLLVGG